LHVGFRNGWYARLQEIDHGEETAKWNHEVLRTWTWED
jgi:hypothetical protein